jgi:hypothetical protein
MTAKRIKEIGGEGESSNTEKPDSNNTQSAKI